MIYLIIIGVLVIGFIWVLSFGWKYGNRFRIVTIRKGVIDYYQPEIQLVYLGGVTVWMPFWVSLHDGDVHHWSSLSRDRQDALQEKYRYEKLFGVKLGEVVWG